MSRMAIEQRDLPARAGGSVRPQHSGPVVVVMPAYNAARTLASTFVAIPKGAADMVILVDDGSDDDTLKVAHDLRLLTVRHPHNVGYGGNQKTCYLEALRQGADVVIMLHPDGQYDPGILAEMAAAIIPGERDVVLGSRFAVKGAAREGGMPWWKRLSNRFLTACENAVLRLGLSEYHSGYRACSRRFLETVPFLRTSNDFVFDTQILIQAAAFGFKVGEVPVSTKYFADASSVGFRVSLIYGLKTMASMVRYLLHRLGLRWRILVR
jgi:glycosyltransferase involved in cell wall biosynthesis